MNKRILFQGICILVFLASAVQFFNSCEKLGIIRLLKIDTGSAANVTSSSCIIQGQIIDLGNSDITQHGHCWSTSPNPSTSDSSTVLGATSEVGVYVSILAELTPGTDYYFRAYATNREGTIYGNIDTLTTDQIDFTIVTTTSVTNITDSSANSGGEVTLAGGVTIISQGICWGLLPDPTLTDHVSEANTTATTFTSLLTDLSCKTNYFVRAYATTSSDTIYGQQVSFISGNCMEGNTISTTPVTGLTDSTAQTGGHISDTIGTEITARGVCWSTSQNPTVADSHTADGSGTGDYSSIMTGLFCETTYYVRAYAKTVIDTIYGQQVVFSSGVCPDNKPEITTTSVIAITTTSAQSGGNITDTGGPEITSRGVCWSTSQNPTLANDHTMDGSGTGDYTSNITGLSCDNYYHIRAYATSSADTIYGQQISFWTDFCPAPLDVSTAVISNITETTAQSGGDVEYYPDNQATARGVCWSTSPNPTIADNITTDGAGYSYFISIITGLSCETTYYLRAYATNSYGTGYGQEYSFTTKECNGFPGISTRYVSSITETTAQSGGHVLDAGSSGVIARGICWSTSPDPTIADHFTSDGSGTGSFTSSISGLSLNTTYYLRSYATNNEGTGYGDEVIFKTYGGTVSDFDGNTYRIVTIGDQTWMADNLRVTHYADGTAIPYVDDRSEWVALDYPDRAYSWAGGSSSAGETYGAYYTWAGAMNGTGSSETNPSGIQGVCPSGWHLPSDEEWKQLEIYLGMSLGEVENTGGRGVDEGGKLKETYISHWNSPNFGATNSSGFTAVASGFRLHANGNYLYTGMTAKFWSATEFDGQTVWLRSLWYESSTINRYANTYDAKDSGLSVRCVRDE